MSGLIIWAGHFFGLYIVASLFPGRALANGLALALTLASVAAAGWLLWRTIRTARSESDDALGGWISGVAAAGNALAMVAIVYQAVPAILL